MSTNHLENIFSILIGIFYQQDEECALRICLTRKSFLQKEMKKNLFCKYLHKQKMKTTFSLMLEATSRLANHLDRESSDFENNRYTYLYYNTGSIPKELILWNLLLVWHLDFKEVNTALEMSNLKWQRYELTCKNNNKH